MRETQQAILISTPEAAPEVEETSGVADKLIRAARMWALVVAILVLLNFALAVYHLFRASDSTSFFTHQLFIPFLTIIYALLGRAIISQQPGNWIGWIFLVVSTFFLLTGLAGSVIDGHGLGLILSTATLTNLAYWLGNWAWLPAQLLPLTFVFLLFPDGHLPSRRWLPIGWAAGLGLFLLMLAMATHPGPVSEWGTVANPYGIAGAEAILNAVITVSTAILVVGALGSMLAVVVRFRRSRGIERAQMKWLIFSVVVIVILGVVMTPLWLSGNLPTVLAMELSIILSNFMTLGIALAVTAAIMRYRLYDIDVLINRTLVYGVMTAVVFVIYALVVGAAGLLFESQGNWLLALLATGLVAILFQPIRDRLQRGVNRLLYGQRDEPFAVLARLGQRLEQSVAPDTLYPTIVETVANALRLPYVALQTCQGEGFETVKANGRPAAEPVVLPLNNGGEVVGRLLVGPRPGEEGFSEADLQLLQNIARQAGAAVYNARLASDLQRSRQQLVTSREEERRRLRRDLHDGLGPSLASLLLEARVLRRLIRDDPAAAETLADEMQGDIRATIEDIRRVVHELRPPALDELGLIPAINVLAAKMGQPNGQSQSSPGGLQVQVAAPEPWPGLPAAVEVAAYRIVQEALANVVHHADACRATVRLWLDGELHIEVADDGLGINGGRAGGLGLRSMRERAAELGGAFAIAPLPDGGTIVRATLPLQVG